VQTCALPISSTYYVNKMRQENLLQKIDKSKLTNFKNLDKKLLDGSYDPDNEYSVPYLWGTTGLAVNAAEIDPSQVTSWADLWKPEYKGQVLLTRSEERRVGKEGRIAAPGCRTAKKTSRMS